MVGHRNPRAPKTLRFLREGLIPAEPSGLLQRQMLPLSPALHVKGTDGKRNLQASAKLPHIGLVPVGLRAPQTMIYMHCGQRCALFSAQLFQQEKQAYGIRTSRYARHNPVSRTNHLIFFCKCTHTIQHFPVFLS